MKKTSIIKLSAMLALLLLFVSCAKKDFSLTIMHVNDTHARLEPESLKVNGIHSSGRVRAKAGGFAALSQKINEIRSKRTNTLLLHAGDVFAGTLYFLKYMGQADGKIMKEMGFDAMAIGNHEFDKGSEPLANFIKDVDGAFPVLCANLSAEKDKHLSKLAEPYTVKEIDGEKVGIIGVVTETTSYVSSPSDETKFLDAVNTVRKYVKELEGKGVNKIIVLSHMGFLLDSQLGSKVAGIDIIVGGHSHTLLGDFSDLSMQSGMYPSLVRNPESGDKVLLVQAWEYTKVLGVLDVVFDGEGKVKSYNGKPQVILTAGMKKGDKSEFSEAELAEVKANIEKIESIDYVEADPKVDKIIKDFKAGLASINEEIVGKAGDNLYHVRYPFKSHPIQLQTFNKGSFIAPHVAEAYLWRLEENGMDVDMSIINAGGVRIDIPKGDISLADVYTLLPFGNTLYLIELTPKQIKDSIENAVERAITPGGSSGAFPYVAGLEYDVDMSKSFGERVSGLKFIDKNGNVKPINSKDKYRVVTLSYIAGGGDGYAIFAKSKGERLDTGIVDAEAFADYVKAKGTLGMPGDDMFLIDAIPMLDQ